MRKLITQLPDDWIFQGASMTLITAFTFHLFQYADRIWFIENLWTTYEKAYIYTFLGIQIAVKLFFYWLLVLVMRKFIIAKIKHRISERLKKPKSIQDLKDISALKKIVISVFGLPLSLGIIDEEDINTPIDTSEDEYELEDFMKSVSKWCCLCIHLAFTLILVVGLSAFYIIPLLIIILLLIIGFWYGAYLVIGSAQIVEKARQEFVKKNK